MARTNEELHDEIRDLKNDMLIRDGALHDKLDKTYLRIQVFEAEIRPLRKFIYGLIAIAGGALLTAIIGLVVVA